MKKPTITPEMAEKSYRYLVECAGLDWDHDGFTADHVGKMIWAKGFEAGFAEAKRIQEKKNTVQGSVQNAGTSADSHPGVGE